jgi:hypothetical protein
MNLYAVNKDPFICARELDDKTLCIQIKATCAMVTYIETQESSKGIDLTLKKWACPGSTSSNDNAHWIKIFNVCLFSEYQYRFNKIHELYNTMISEIKKALVFKGVGCMILYHRPMYKALDFSWMYPTTMAYQFLLRSKYLSYDPTWTNRDKPSWVEESHYQWRTLKMRFCHTQTSTCLRCGNPIKIKRYEGIGLDSFSFKCKTKGCLVKLRGKI